MTAYRFIVFATCAALAACAQEPSRAPQDEAPAQGAARPPRVVTAKPEPRRPPLPDVELSEELMFKMMMAEVALQRAQPHIAVQAYLELARETRDPRIAQRAAEVAWNARLSSAALERAPQLRGAGSGGHLAAGRPGLGAGAPAHRGAAGQPGPARGRAAAPGEMDQLQP